MKQIADARQQFSAIYPDAQIYFDRFDRFIARDHKNTLAVIKVGGGVIEDAELLADCLQALSQLCGLGYYPVIVHGGGPQISQALDGLSDPAIFRDGLRVTSSAAIGLVAQALSAVNQELVRQLDSVGVAACGQERVFEARVLDRDSYGEVGRVVDVETDGIFAALTESCLPVVSCLGHDNNGEPLNVNGDDAASELVASLRPLEYISFTPTGGVNGTDGGLIRHITPGYLKQLEDNGQLTGGMLKKVTEAMDVVKTGSVEKAIIVHPRHLLEELFSDDGYGTTICLD